MVNYKRISDSEREAAKTLLGAHEPFRAIRGAMPLQYVTSFLLVAEEEGLGVVDYAKRAGVSISVMSRHLLDIGERNRNMTDGFGLVTYRSNPMELRRHEYMLTDKGRAVLHQIERQLRHRGGEAEISRHPATNEYVELSAGTVHAPSV